MDITPLKRMKIYKNDAGRLSMIFELSLPQILSPKAEGEWLFNRFYYEAAEVYILGATELSLEGRSGLLKMSVSFSLEEKRTPKGITLACVRRKVSISTGYKNFDEDFFDITNARIISRRKYNKTTAKS